MTLVHQYQILPTLQSALQERTNTDRPPSSRPGENTQVLHGLVSLLKHLAIPGSILLLLDITVIIADCESVPKVPNKPLIASRDTFKAMTSCLSPSHDLASPLQAAAIGVIKVLVTNNLGNAVLFLEEPTSLSIVLSLAERSDEARIKSESARAISALIRAIWSAPRAETRGTPSEEQIKATQKQITASVDRSVKIQIVLLQASSKWPLLLNESIIALTLLVATGGEAGEYPKT